MKIVAIRGAGNGRTISRQSSMPVSALVSTAIRRTETGKWVRQIEGA